MIRESKTYCIIVTYNGEHWIEKCLNSIKNSSENLSILIIDNKSTDNTIEVIEKNFSDVKIIKSKKNLGFGKANNIGLEIAYRDGADYFLLLNQDVFIEKNTIKTLIHYSRKEPNYGVISPIHLNGRGSALDYNFSMYISPEKCKNLISDMFLNKLQPKLYSVPFVNAAAWLITKKCIENIGGFSDSFHHYGEDNNYCQRVLYHGLKIGVSPHTIIYHDRETRTTNKYFKDSKVEYARSVTINCSNPNTNNSLKRIRTYLLKSIIKGFLTLNFNNSLKSYNKLRVLNRLNKKIILTNKRKSMNKGPSFLNLNNIKS